MAKPKTKTKTKIGGVPIETRARKKHLPSNAFKKGNTAGFQPGTSGNPGGKPKCDRDRLIGRSLIRYLQDHAPDDACKTHDLPPHSSWGQILAKRLIRCALQGQQWAYSEILSLTETRNMRLGVFGFDNEAEEKSVIQLEFVSSNGDGKPCAEFLEAHPNFVIGGKSIRALPASED
jgi:Family of unknown function (DUF5681)